VYRIGVFENSDDAYSLLYHGRVRIF
jgi:hypothetical protein